MADFNSRLLDLIHAYHIDRHHPWFYEKVRAERLLKEFWAGWLEKHQGGTWILLYEKRGDLENFYMSMPDGVCHRAVRHRNDDMFSCAECIPQIRNGGARRILC